MDMAQCQVSQQSKLIFMIKKLLISFVAVSSIIAGAFSFSSALPALAYSPTLNIYSNGVNNGNVTVSISGAQPNSTVTIYYYTQSAPNQAIVAGTFGTTDYSGNFSASEPYGNDAQSGVTARYAMIGNVSTNTVSSTSYAYGYNGGYNGGGYSNGTVTFSNTNPTMAVGQSLSVNLYSTANNIYGYSSFSISNNSNNAVVSATISGSTLQLYGLIPGSSTISICLNPSSYNYTNSCGTLFVTVTGSSYGTGTISFAQNSVSLSVGQSVSDALYNSNNLYGGALYISSNTNSAAVSATISGTSLQLYALAAGSTSISVCSTATAYANYGNNSCASVYVTVSGSNYSTGTITANPINPYLAFGQSLGITLSQTVYNGYSSGYFTISSNANPGVVSATISGNILSVYGLNYGTDVITVCSTNNSYSYGSNSCLPITITVNNNGSGNGGNGNNSGIITFSNTNPTLNAGQSTSVNLYANSAYTAVYNYYIASNSNATVVSGSISGSTLQLYGASAGSATLNICASSTSSTTAPACANLYVTVTGTNGSGQVLGVSTYVNGQLIQEGQQISIIYRNTKTPFTNYSAFTGLGFQAANVLNVGYSNVSQSSHVVSTAFASHPWGSWIKNGTTVYFVSEYGLIPIADYQTFIANGGQNVWVVQANAYDLQLPMQSVMVYNDSRLR